ncbi:unnamed protein product [Blepharisma stoltei]|uniref:Kelch motif family protein n=1 Tax=Blepharisma stoltei TaxID=1481888 RepID=A0AAU9IW49_9CILI|nr:unnamed protein product [Blepharisma stoltei]
MDELVTCSVGCQNKPIVACDCSDKEIFICNNHLVTHGESAGKHHFTRIMKNPELQTKITISKFLKSLKLQVKQNRSKLIQESSFLIKKINEAAEKSLGELISIEKRLDEYIRLCDTLEEVNNLNSKSFIESALKLSPEDSRKIKLQEDIMMINNSGIKEKIESLFSVKEAKLLFDIDNFEVLRPIKVEPIIKYFKNRDLFAVDVVSQTSISQNINKNWKGWDPTCLLNDGSVFCCFDSETFIITPKHLIIPLDSSRYSNYSGLIAIDDFVYMFGGSGNASFKFSLGSKHWNTIAQYPVSGNRYISCAFINSVILIVGYESPYLYGYNISNNSYTNVPITLNSKTGKTILATKNKAYIIDYNRSCYESGLNDINTWTPFGTANMLEEGYPRHSYSLLYKDSFYFITCGNKLIEFDLKNKQLKLLKWNLQVLYFLSD